VLVKNYFIDMIKTFEQYNKNTMKKILYVTTGDLGKIADKWIKENPHNNGYAVKWQVIEPEESAYPEIENFLLSNGLNIGDEAILHSVW
jgi:hypothetical protein